MLNIETDAVWTDKRMRQELLSPELARAAWKRSRTLQQEFASVGSFVAYVSSLHRLSPATPPDVWAAWQHALGGR